MGVPGNTTHARHRADNPDAAVAAVAGDCLGERRIKRDELLLTQDVRIDNQEVLHAEGRTGSCQRQARWKAVYLFRYSSGDSRGIEMEVGWVRNMTIRSQSVLREEHSLVRKRWSDARGNNLVTDEKVTRGFAGEDYSDRVAGTELGVALLDMLRESKSSLVDLPASCRNSERPYSAWHAYQRVFLN